MPAAVSPASPGRRGPTALRSPSTSRRAARHGGGRRPARRTPPPGVEGRALVRLRGCPAVDRVNARVAVGAQLLVELLAQPLDVHVSLAVVAVCRGHGAAKPAHDLAAGSSGELLVLEARGNILGIHAAMDEVVEEATLLGLSEPEVDGQ